MDQLFTFMFVLFGRSYTVTIPSNSQEIPFSRIHFHLKLKLTELTDQEISFKTHSFLVQQADEEPTLIRSKSQLIRSYSSIGILDYIETSNFVAAKLYKT